MRACQWFELPDPRFPDENAVREEATGGRALPYQPLARPTTVVSLVDFDATLTRPCRTSGNPRGNERLGCAAKILDRLASRGLETLGLDRPFALQNL